jgi:hypothetical protein
MNASGRLNTCKSNGQVAILVSGARVRNAYTTCLYLGDSVGKLAVTPHVIVGRHFSAIKTKVDKDWCAYD